MRLRMSNLVTPCNKSTAVKIATQVYYTKQHGRLTWEKHYKTKDHGRKRFTSMHDGKQIDSERPLPH